MTTEDKQILLQDLSARLPYGVIVNYKEDEYDFHKWKIETLHAPAYSESGLLIETDSDGWIGYTEYKGCGMSRASRALHLDKNLPYLRPMSSMTTDEKQEYDKAYDIDLDECAKSIKIKLETDNSDSSGTPMFNHIDWLNAHHFDYRGLIPMGLAIEAPETMYSI